MALLPPCCQGIFTPCRDVGDVDLVGHGVDSNYYPKTGSYGALPVLCFAKASSMLIEPAACRPVEVRSRGLTLWISLYPRCPATLRRLSIDVREERVMRRIVLHLLAFTFALGSLSAIAQQASSNPLRFIPVAPCRVVDTRLPNGTFGGP